MNKISDILCNKVNKNITQIILDYCFTEDKKKYLQEFKDKSSIGNEFYGEFYKITKLINKAFK